MKYSFLFSARAEAEEIGRKAQELWLSCQSLQATLNTTVDEDEPTKPLLAEVEAIKKAGNTHPFVQAVVGSIPEQGLEKGVFTQEQLTERFEKVGEGG